MNEPGTTFMPDLQAIKAKMIFFLEESGQ